MRSYRKELWFDVRKRREFINITPEVKECLRESGIREGFVLCNAMHITASVFINDDEPGLHHDFEVWLQKLAPEKPHSQYRHNGFEDNADAHLKRSVMGREALVAVTAGKPGAGYARERHGSCRPRTVPESPLGRRGSRRQFGSFEQEEPTAVFFLARPEQLPALFTEGVQQV